MKQGQLTQAEAIQMFTRLNSDAETFAGDRETWQRAYFMLRNLINRQFMTSLNWR